MPEIMSNTNFFIYQYLLYCQIVLLKIQRDMSKDDDASITISPKCCSMLLLWFYLVQKHALMNHQYLIFRPYKIHHHSVESFQIVWQLKVFCTFCFNFIVKCLINKIENAFKSLTFEFSRNVFTEMFVIKRFKLAASPVGDQNAASVPRRRWETGTLNWPQFMLQWFIRFPKFAEFTEFPFH